MISVKNKEVCSAYLIKSKSMKGLINSPFQPVQCGRKSEKINNKEPDYILQLSDSSEKHLSLWLSSLSCRYTLFI